MSSRPIKLEKVRIENLRAIKDQTVEIGDYTAFVGPNGAGKSTVLFALNFFFQEGHAGATSAKFLSIEDFHAHRTDEPIRVTVTFGELSEEARADFAHYLRQGKLVITAEARFDAKSNQILVEQKGQRMVMKAFAPFFEAEANKGLVADLKEVYQGLKKTYSLADATTKDAMRAALRDYEEAHSDHCEMIESADQFYGISKGANRLEKYLQWVYVPAVKEATDEQQEGKDTALGKLLERTIRGTVDFKGAVSDIKEKAQAEYGKMLDDKRGVLSELEKLLSDKLMEYAHPDCGLNLEWAQEPAKAISVQEPLALAKAHEFGMSPHLVGRCGHGMQRSFLLALLEILADADKEGAPLLILGVDEAELFQHPPQARHLASLLQSLAAGNCQVLVTTHSPNFVSAESFESVRLVRRQKPEQASVVSQATFTKLSARIASADGVAPTKAEGVQAKLGAELSRGLNELFFTRTLVLVEGIEDVAYIEAHAMLWGHWDLFRKYGVLILPAHNKSNLIRPSAVAHEFGIPTYIVYDSDGQEQVPDKRNKHQSDNSILQKLQGELVPEPFPQNDRIESNFAAWVNNIGTTVQADFEPADYARFKTSAAVLCGHVSGMGKNPTYIAAVLSEAHADNKKSDALERLCVAITALGRVQESAAS